MVTGFNPPADQRLRVLRPLQIAVSIGLLAVLAQLMLLPIVLGAQMNVALLDEGAPLAVRRTPRFSLFASRSLVGAGLVLAFSLSLPLTSLFLCGRSAVIGRGRRLATGVPWFVSVW